MHGRRGNVTGRWLVQLLPLVLGLVWILVWVSLMVFLASAAVYAIGKYLFGWWG